MATISRAKAKRVKLRDTIFPGAAKVVYDATEDGWRQVPRTLALVMTLVSSLAEKGLGKGAARVYHELWLRDYGDGCVELTDEDVHAFAAGYTNPARGPRDWRDCMVQLEKLGFIRIAPKGSRQLGYVLLVNPHRVVEQLSKEGKVDVAWLNAYRQRRIEIGADS